MSSISCEGSQLERAKDVFFHEGSVAAGTLDDAILRSWQRCRSEGRAPADHVEFEVVRGGSLEDLIDSNRRLISAAEPSIANLANAVAGAGYSVLLTDAHGSALVVHGATERLGAVLRKALRPGVDLSERAIGTNAMCSSMYESRPIRIDGAEHYFSQYREFQCIAAPIFDHCGSVVGAIDVSRDTLAAQSATVSLVADCARSIETALFMQVPAYVTARLHWADSHDVMNTSLGLLSFGPDGTIVATDMAGRALLGIRHSNSRLAFEDFFAGRFGEFVSALKSRRSTCILRMHGGLCLRASVMGGTTNVSIAKPGIVSHEASSERVAIREFGDDCIPDRLEKAARALKADLPILIQGETGVGKEVAARVLHSKSKYGNGPFVAINCAAIPKDLIEGELFGYADGAFTGARRGGAKGKIEQANHGTLFLDEVGDMPLELQTRLLRVLERKEVTRLGDHAVAKVDVQIICATHQDLEMLVTEGAFRKDLFYRIEGYTLILPPLRLRNKLADLVEYLCEEEGIEPHQLTAEMRDCLLAYAWPGNVRELRNVLRHANAMRGSGDMLRREHLPDRLAQPGDLVNAQGAVEQMPKSAIRDMTSIATERAIAECQGNITLAAKRLGISRSTLHRWLKSKSRDSNPATCQDI